MTASVATSRETVYLTQAQHWLHTSSELPCSSLSPSLFGTCKAVCVQTHTAFKEAHVC